MQFRRGQRAELQKSWNSGSWFYRHLGSESRGVIERAYGLENCDPKTRAREQEVVTLALTFFAQKIGCDKSHVVHALLSGSIHSLKRALQKLGKSTEERPLQDNWSSSLVEARMHHEY